MNRLSIHFAIFFTMHGVKHSLKLTTFLTMYGLSIHWQHFLTMYGLKHSLKIDYIFDNVWLYKDKTTHNMKSGHFVGFKVNQASPLLLAAALCTLVVII